MKTNEPADAESVIDLFKETIAMLHDAAELLRES